jgi:hypothetical protein
VVAEVAGIRPTAEEAMERGHLHWNRRAHRLAVGQAVQLQLSHRASDGFVEPRRGLAGGRGQADAQRTSGIARQREGLQHRQQAHHGGRLAGAGAAGDDGKGAAGGQRAGELLPVQPVGGGRKQRVERSAQGVGRQIDGRGEAGIDGLAHRAFVLPVAAQVIPPAHRHQRRSAGAVSHQIRMSERGLPAGQIQPGQHLGRQRRTGFAAAIAVGRE